MLCYDMHDNLFFIFPFNQFNELVLAQTNILLFRLALLQVKLE